MNTDEITWSVGEIRALVIKAARGSGMDWGMAQEAGFAFEWLARNGVPATLLLADYLSHVDTQSECTYECCPFKLGAHISDTGDIDLCNQSKTLSPLLLAPFIAVSLENQSVVLYWNENKAFLSSGDILIEIKEANKLSPTQALLKPNKEAFTALPKMTRVRGTEAIAIERLTELAHKTYAPATEASRLAGAGAGLNDND